jgi:hypothetical protein
MLVSDDLLVNGMVDFIVIILKSALFIREPLGVELELLLVNQFQEVFPRNKQIEDGQYQEDDGEIVCSISDLHIKYKLAQESPEESEIEEEEAFHGKVSGDITFKA